MYVCIYERHAMTTQQASHMRECSIGVYANSVPYLQWSFRINGRVDLVTPLLPLKGWKGSTVYPLVNIQKASKSYDMVTPFRNPERDVERPALSMFHQLFPKTTPFETLWLFDRKTGHVSKAIESTIQILPC